MESITAHDIGVVERGLRGSKLSYGRKGAVNANCVEQIL